MDGNGNSNEFHQITSPTTSTINQGGHKGHPRFLGLKLLDDLLDVFWITAGIAMMSVRGTIAFGLANHFPSLTYEYQVLQWGIPLYFFQPMRKGHQFNQCDKWSSGLTRSFVFLDFLEMED